MKCRIVICAALVLACVRFTYAADSVDVTFRYTVSGFPGGISVPGEFNGWNNTADPMDYTGGPTWVKTIRLAVGGNPSGGIPGAWQYKFYYNGAAPWPNDPLNQHVNHADNDNSFLYVKDPTIYQLVPNQRNPIVLTSNPTMSAYLYPKVGGAVDTSSISLNVDGTAYTGLGAHYNAASQQFVYALPAPLLNGSHTVILRAGQNADTVSFTTQAGFVQILNRFPFTTWKPDWPLNGLVQDSGVTSARVVRNGTDTFTVAVASKAFTFNAPLVEGLNTFTASADSAGTAKISSPAYFTRRVNHAPAACAALSISGDGLHMIYDATCSTDPDTDAVLSYLWKEDPSNPQALGIDGVTAPSSSTLSPPATDGAYHVNLIVADNNGYGDTVSLYFEKNGGQFRFPAYNELPLWAEDARVYFLFPKGASSAGTINAAAQRLQSIKDLGFNVIWVTPVMKNAYPIDNNYGPGYNIVDFYNVAPEYGTNQDYVNFVAQAHALGMKVIQDITTNHSSRFHPWSQDAHTYKQNSVYWGWYEHQEITSNTNGLGDCLDADQFNYYCGFGDQLMNLNWKDADFQAEMINTLKYWATQVGVDGFRFDVYWGPHRRYGEAYMGQPVRDALRHVKPDILLLGEDDGTGVGTEYIYADHVVGGIHGGVDAAYDWKLYHNDIEYFNFSSPGITNLHNDIDNGGYYPGENARYMRFMEDQDEDRIVYFYSGSPPFTVDSITTFMRTMPVASVLFTAPGFPMLWQGQEVGYGYGIQGAKEARTRSVVDWNYSGRFLLSPHYQKLAHIRSEFPAFTQHKRDTNHDGGVNSSDSTDFVNVPTGNGVVYAFARPWWDQNGLTVTNFSATPQSATLDLTASNILYFTNGLRPGDLYYVNNLYDGSRRQVSGAKLSSLPVNLSPFGTAIFTVSTTADSLLIENPIMSVKETHILPASFALLQNYPNPFNPATELEFGVGETGLVTLRVYDVLGREVATLVNREMHPGLYNVSWDASTRPSGVYFYRLQQGAHTSVRKMLLVR